MVEAHRRVDPIGHVGTRKAGFGTVGRQSSWCEYFGFVSGHEDGAQRVRFSGESGNCSQTPMCVEHMRALHSRLERAEIDPSFFFAPCAEP